MATNLPSFTDADAGRDHLESQLWPDGPVALTAARSTATAMMARRTARASTSATTAASSSPSRSAPCSSAPRSP